MTRSPHVTLIGFARGPIEGARVIARAAAPAWFDAWRSGALRAIAEADLGAALAALDGADHLAIVDGVDLAAAWATVGALGATVVLDVHAQTFHRGDALAARREIRVVLEQTAGGAHALHTRGLRKYGAPDLIALCGQADAALVGRVLRDLAERVAAGLDLAEPRHAISLSPDVTWYAVDDRDGLAALLSLDNPARVLVDDRGRHLVGALARLGGN